MTARAISNMASPKPVEHITYYVDAVSGNDVNPGTSPEAAWKTLARIRQTKYGPGNKVLLHRGQSWLNQPLMIGNGGDDMGDYVPGYTPGMPTVDLMTIMRNANIPQLTYGTIETVVPLDLSGGMVPDTMVEFGAYGDSASPDPIVQYIGIHWTTGIYLHDIEALKHGSEYTTIMQNDMNIVLKDFKTTGMYTDRAVQVRIDNMLSETSQEHGLYLCDSSANFIVEDSVFRNNTASGIQSNATGMNPNASDTVVIKRSKIYGNGIAGFNDVRSKNIIFYRNLIVSGVGKALEIQEVNSGNLYYHNVIVSKGAGQPAVGTGNPRNTFVNNIFYVQDAAIANPRSVFVSDYNGLYSVLRSDHIPTFDWGNTWAWWKTNTGNDTHSTAADPMFVAMDIHGDPGNWDLHLNPDSALIDKGTTVSAALGEAYGFSGAAPDPGMYEGDPSLTLHGAPADQVIRLSWKVNTSLPPAASWRISYVGPEGDRPSPISGILGDARTYALTGLTNFTMYTITLEAMVEGEPVLTATVQGFPSDLQLFFPILAR